MSKMHYLVTNFQKSPSAELLNLHKWWPKVPWFGHVVVF